MLFNYIQNLIKHLPKLKSKIKTAKTTKFLK